MSTTAPEAFLSPADLVAWFAARGLVTSESSVLRWMAAGEVPCRRLGRRLVVPGAALRRWEEGLLTEWSPALIEALRSVEEGAVPQAVAPQVVPSPFVGRRIA